MNILVVGGASSLGSQVVKQLVADNHKVVILDNLQIDQLKTIHKKAAFIQGTLHDKQLLRNIFSLIQYDIVFYFMGHPSLVDAINNPLRYFETNISSLITLLSIMNEFTVKKIIFSSPTVDENTSSEFLQTEETKEYSIRSYNQINLTMKTIIENCHSAYAINYVVLRYFNSTRIDQDTTTVESSPTNFKIILPQKSTFAVSKTDYETKKDYTPVVDLPSAHLLAMDYLMREKKKKLSINI